MKFEEKRVGDFCIYTGAMESLNGDGFMAAVVVQKDAGTGRAPQDIFRDERMAGGHRWSTAREALHFAMQRGLDVTRNASVQPLMLTPDTVVQGTHPVPSLLPANNRSLSAA